jgi:hypothetical protein
VAYDLLSTPEDYVAHFERYATSVVSIIGFGRRVSDPKDPIITEVIAVMHRAADLNVPGKSFPMLMETFPCKSISSFPQPIDAHLSQSWPSFQMRSHHGNTASVLAEKVIEDTTSSIPSPPKPTKPPATMTATPNSCLKSNQNTISDIKKFPPSQEICSAQDPTLQAAL